MRITVVVNEAPYARQAPDSAYHFVRAALDRGHDVARVFFYHEGVHNATRLATPPQDERDVSARWTELARERGVDLVVCVAAAQRRGIADAAEAARHGKDAHNLAPGFRIAGLGLLIEAALDSDRTVTFGA